MKSTLAFLSSFIAAPYLSYAQDLSWCKDEGCTDCPSSLATSGPGYPECVIYDSNVVFGGQGFKEGDGKVKFKVFADVVDPCGGSPGSYMVRSPASLATEGCGDLIYHTEGAECSQMLSIEDTFMIQYCCGDGDCKAANVPWGRRDGGGGMQGGFLQFENGTVIPPLEVGSPPRDSQLSGGHNHHRRDCEGGWLQGSYEPNGEPYLKTFDTQIVSGSVSPEDKDRTITITYDQSVTTSTTFDVSVGDPFGIISASVGFEFSNSETKGFQVQVTIGAGEAGRVGFTPVFECTSGTLEKCEGGRTSAEESCTPYVVSGLVQGDYRVIQT